MIYNIINIKSNKALNFIILYFNLFYIVIFNHFSGRKHNFIFKIGLENLKKKLFNPYVKI